MGRRYTYVAPFLTEIKMSNYFKKLLFAFTVISMLFIFMSVCASGAYCADIYEGDDLCYAPNNIISGVEMTNMGDYVTFRALNNDPFVHLRATTATIADKYILIKYRTTDAGGGQIYFKSAEPSVSINWNTDGEWNTVIVDATSAGTNWTNKSIFRFDPLHSHGVELLGCSIDVQYIAFFASEDAALQFEQEREAEKELPGSSVSSFTFSKYGNGYAISGCTTSEYALEIPETHGGLPVTHIYSDSFTNVERLKYLYIPPTVTSIQSNTFNANTKFKLVGVAGSAAESYARSSGIDFITVTDPSNFIFEVGRRSAKIVGYTGTESNVVLPLFHMGYKITEIGDGAFEGNAKIKSVSFVYCIEWIGENAFASSSLTSVSLGESVKYIGKSAFAECTSLSSVSMQSVRSIGDFAFFNCKSLSSINLPTSTESIGLRAFAQTALKTVTLPANIITVNRYAFLKCSSLTAIYVDSANGKFSSENGILYDYSKKTVYICPEGKTGTVTLNKKTENIGRGAFINCDRLNGVDISSVNTINALAFYDCDILSMVTVPNTVGTVNEYAFSECDNILIKCYISTAIQYHCTKFLIPFEITYTDFILGDANGDSKINGKDMVRIRAYLTSPYIAIIKDAADIDSDSDIDANDLTKLSDMIFNGK